MSSPRGGGGGGGWATHGNLIVVYIPRVGILIGHHAFDLSILYSRREVNDLFLLILTILFRPGVGILNSLGKRFWWFPLAFSPCGVQGKLKFLLRFSFIVSLRFYFVYTHLNSACVSIRRKFDICTCT